MHLKALFARWNGLTLSTQIIIGLLVGVFIGVFFGQEAARINWFLGGGLDTKAMTAAVAPELRNQRGGDPVQGQADGAPSR